ncbi:hypothetical protein [uncultured Halomonas sp.]|jgi:hypothetical protein|uniref:hypothetical protein n=1 Tax=uncultured Halomonas sp. TaxID=173971 RepID=UPI00263714E0|nr:hypothetical protein [uncultured Halomonas sp.]
MALYRHSLIGTYPGEVWTFGVHSEGNISLAAAQSAWATGVTNFASAAYLGDLCADVAFTEITTAELDPATGGQLGKASDPRSEVGTSVDACLPFQCAPVVSLRTALANRSGRGRFYAPSPAVSAQDGGRLVAAAQTNLADSALGLMNGLTGAGLTPVIVNRATLGTTPITSLDVGDVIDTQRRRRNKLIESRTSRVI